jgi:hypothetical protein
MKLGLTVFALFLLVKTTMRAGHPGSMNPDIAGFPIVDRLQGSYKPRG